jgi:hypothetical protein
MKDSYIEIRNICALRFDGYKYAKAQGTSLVDLSSRAESEFPFESELDNFAAFFALQRYLFKWGGESLPPNHPLHQLFERMFRQLAPLPTPSEFANAEYDRKWQIIWSRLSSKF